MTVSNLSRAVVAFCVAAVFGCAHTTSSGLHGPSQEQTPTTATAATAPSTQTASNAASTVFATPEAAVAAVAAASRSQDPAALSALLGPGAEDVVFSGDPVADQNARLWFTQAYDAYHALTENPDGSRTLEIGVQHWPMPIPIAQDRSTGRWHFDVPAGRDEIVNRRIGRNELACIQVCHAIVDAQQEYAMADPDHDGVPAYAQRFVSHAGKKDGLYWPAQGDQPLSPLGGLFADAADDGYSTTQPIGPRNPYHGYYYHILKTQGPGAAGGARDYRINGQMIGGFAVVAWPADYGNSGVMTFLVNQEGVVYQRNLGEQTPSLARAMTAFDPTPQWTRADPPPASQATLQAK